LCQNGLWSALSIHKRLERELALAFASRGDQGFGNPHGKKLLAFSAKKETQNL
jgi:hypothetical protein